MIGELIRVVYNYFQLFLLVPFVVSTEIIRSKRLKWDNGVKVLIFGWVIAMVCLIPTIAISRTYLFYDRLEIWTDNDGQAKVNSIDYGVGIVYLDIPLGKEKVDIKLPYGMERKVIITANDSCQVSMQIDKADYEDSYVLADNTENDLTIYTDTPKMKLLSELITKVILVIFITNLIISISKWIMYHIPAQTENKRMFGGGANRSFFYFYVYF